MVLRTQDARARDIENSNGENQEANEYEQSHAQFRPRQLFAARHFEIPPQAAEGTLKTLYSV
jgi:hypothetical protein